MPETRSSLLQRLRSSSCDEKSWREFVALYEPLLLRYVQARGLAENDAIDVVQNVFASLLEALRKFELDHSRGRFRTWLWRVTQNAIADWSRRQKRRRAAEDGWRETIEEFGTSSTEELEEEWETACRQRVMEFSLVRIRDETRSKSWSCFEQHILKGRPAADVATELGLSAGAVYVNASRVLARVRRKCTEYLEDLE